MVSIMSPAVLAALFAILRYLRLLLPLIIILPITAVAPPAIILIPTLFISSVDFLFIVSLQSGFYYFTPIQAKYPERKILMATLNIVLVEPEIPQNTGNIARTCAATGSRLHIIEPMGFKIDDRKLKRAGLDYWHLLDITYYKNLDDFFSKNNGKFYYFSTKAQNRYSDVSYPDNSYLFFGKETKGLPEDLLYKNPDNCVRIPMINDSAARSLNLSNSVAIAVYEVLRQWDFPELLTKGKLTQYKW